jgi:hypothetical protein
VNKAEQLMRRAAATGVTPSDGELLAVLGGTAVQRVARQRALRAAVRRVHDRQQVADPSGSAEEIALVFDAAADALSAGRAAVSSS